MKLFVEHFETYHKNKENGKFLVISGLETVAYPDKTRTGIHWFISEFLWVLLVRIWFRLGVTGILCSRRWPEIVYLTQKFERLAPLDFVWLESIVSGRVLELSGSVWPPPGQKILPYDSW